MKTYLGMDFGGTKLLIGEYDHTGKILRSKRYATGALNQGQAVKILFESLEDYQRNVGFEGELAGAGLGIVGVVNHNEGLWLSINHIVTEPPIPLVSMIEEKLGVPAAIDNDVRSTTMAELLFGYGRQSQNFIYLNVGTGLAAGFVIDGKILRGANNNSGEIGHMVTNLESGYECICGRYGCAENVVSGVGFAQNARNLYPHYSTSLNLQGDCSGIDVKEIFHLADEGDPLCVELTRQAVNTLACVIMNLIRVTDPDMLILGGGIVSDGWLIKRVKEILNPATIRGLRNGIVLSGFQPQNAGLAGAAALAMVASGLTEKN
jgi:predicted NBD/HSP70 family sugar kinase